jgi:hypothetical protein
VSEVFISYAREDKERIAPILEGLRSLGLAAWTDAPLNSGEHWDAEIERCLREAKVVLVCWSKDSIHSVRVNGEASVAQSQDKLASCLLEECNAPAQFQSQKAENLSDWTGGFDHAGWHELVKRISAFVGRPGLPSLLDAVGIANERERLAWTQRFPEDPYADVLRSEIEKRERSRFEVEIASARKALSDAATLMEQSKNTVLMQCSTAFERWIAGLETVSYDTRPNVAHALSSPEEWLNTEAVQRLAAERDTALKEKQAALEARDAALMEARSAIVAPKEASKPSDARIKESRIKQQQPTAVTGRPWIILACLASLLAGVVGYRTFAGSGGGGPDVERQTRQELDQSKAQLQKVDGELAVARDDLAAQLKNKDAELDQKTEALNALRENAGKLQAALKAANAQIDALQRATPAAAAKTPQPTPETPGVWSEQKRQSVKFSVFDSGDLQGADIEKLSSASAQDCASACRKNPACRAYSYDKWNHYCFPKSSVGVLRLEPRAVSGVIEGEPTPKKAASRITMEQYHGRAFPGARFKTLIVEQPEDCQEICRQEEACVAYTFLWTNSKCQLLGKAGEYFPNEDAESGGKKQAR